MASTVVYELRVVREMRTFMSGPANYRIYDFWESKQCMTSVGNYTMHDKSRKLDNV